MPERLHILKAAALRNGRLTTRGLSTPLQEIPHSDPLSSAALAVADALLAHIPPIARHTIGLIHITRLGCLSTDRDFDRSRLEGFPSPAAFSRTLPSTLAAEIALAQQLTGPSITICPLRRQRAWPLALARAAGWMAAFRQTHVLVISADLTLTGSPQIRTALLAK